METQFSAFSDILFAAAQILLHLRGYNRLGWRCWYDYFVYILYYAATQHIHMKTYS